MHAYLTKIAFDFTIAEHQSTMTEKAETCIPCPYSKAHFTYTEAVFNVNEPTVKAMMVADLNQLIGYRPVRLCIFEKFLTHLGPFCPFCDECTWKIARYQLQRLFYLYYMIDITSLLTLSLPLLRPHRV